MPTFWIEGDWRSVLARIFEAGEDGRLGFGWNGRSLASASLDDLIARPVRFRDYLMEGFLFYEVQAEARAQGCLLRIRGLGSNRDQYLRGHFRFFIEQAGLCILAGSAEFDGTGDDPTIPSSTAGASRRGVIVHDAFEVQAGFGIALSPGLITVLDGFPSRDPQKYVDRPVVIRADGSEPRFARVGAVRDHGTTISFFFQNLTRADVPIGSRIEFEA